MLKRLSVVAVLLCVVPAFGADPKPIDAKSAAVEALIQAGLKAYKDGQTQRAVAALQEAIAQMQKQQEKGLASFFPKAPDGWEAGEIDTQSATFGTGKGSESFTTLNRTYTRKTDQMEVQVSLVNSPQLVESHKAMAEAYKNPAMLKELNADGNKNKMIERDGWIGWLTVSKDDNATITAFNKSYVLTITVDKPDEAVLNSFWMAIDVKGLAGSLSPGRPTPTSMPAKPAPTSRPVVKDTQAE